MPTRGNNRVFKTHHPRPYSARRVATVVTVAALTAAGALALSAPAFAIPTPSTVYVSPGGIDSSTCGGVDQKCLTIQHGVDRAESGDTVQVAAGTYHEGVTITKGVTLQGAGAASTIIDGTDVDPGPNGLVDIGTTDGDLTISGFTMQNPFIGTVAGPYTVTMTDTNAADHVTFSHNTILGSPDDPDYLTNAPVGIDSANTSAPTTITDNDFSDLWQAVLLEGNQGALDVSGNHFHDLTPYDDGTSKYPAEGVYVLSDKEGSATDQNVTDNTFDSYNGIGIAYSAGYDLGGCTGTPCSGSVTGTITGNTFQLAANSDGFATASAIRLRSINAGDELNLTMGGNTGTVTAPTKTIEETPTSGSITITPTSLPDSIVPTPTPTIDANIPASITTGAAPVSFASSAANPTGGDDIAHARYDITLTGTSGISAADITLQYESSPGTYSTVPLEGTASAGNKITGYFGPFSGFPFPASATANVTNFKLSVPSTNAETGRLTSTVSLDEVSSGSGHPAINTLATDTSTIDIAATSSLSVQLSPVHPTTATVTSAKVTVTTAGQPNGGTVTIRSGASTYTGKVVNKTATVKLRKYTSGGSHTISVNFGGTASALASSTTKTFTVAKVKSTLAFSTKPANITSKTAAPKAIVAISAKGASVYGATVTIKQGSHRIGSATVQHGKARITLPKLAAGTYHWTVRYAGTQSSAAATKTVKVVVTKA
jgi:hypothetical protein